MSHLRYYLFSFFTSVLFFIIGSSLYNHFFSPQQFINDETIRRSIEFAPENTKANPGFVSVQTALCRYTFYEGGGIVSNIVFHKYKGRDGLFDPVRPRSAFIKDEGLFLLALDNEQTPYFYKHITTRERGEKTQVLFAAKNSEWRVEKRYTLYHNSYRVDIEFRFIPLLEGDLVSPIKSPRIFFPAPFIAELSNEETNGFYLKHYQEDGWFNKRGEQYQEKINGKYTNQTVIEYPIVAGIEDRYFTYACVKHDNFIKRFYFKQIDYWAHGLVGILEGQDITEQLTVKTSWYIGPKAEVENFKESLELEKFNTYGLITPLGKALYKLLIIVAGLIGSLGLAALAIGAGIRLFLSPFFIYARYKFERLQAFQEEFKDIIEAIKNRYKDSKDPYGEQEALSAFYSENGVSRDKDHLFVIITKIIPFFLLHFFNTLFTNQINLYRTSFGWWIIDLSAKDPLFVLPILYCIFNLLNINDIKQSIGGALFTSVLMTYVFSNYPAGALLFLLGTTIVDTLEQSFVYALKQF